MAEEKGSAGDRDNVIITLEDVVTLQTETPDVKAITLWDEVSAAPVAGREAAEQLLKKLLSDARFVKGYRAAAVINENGRVLAADRKDDPIEIERLSGEMNWLYSDARATADRIGLTPPDAFTLHTSTGIVLVQQVETGSDRFRVILICSLQGNWYYFKVRLENLNVRPKAAKA